MLQIIVIVVIIFVAVAFLIDARRRFKVDSSEGADFTRSLEIQPAEKLADEQLPTETGRHRAQAIVKKATEKKDSSDSPATHSDNDDEALPDPFEE